MGNSRFRLSHVMPNVWFYKLKDIGTFRESQRRRLASARDETAVSLPRISHHFGRSERVYNHRPMHKAQTVDLESMKRKTSKGKKSKGGSSSTIRDSRISAGCSCRATVDSVWKSRETRDDFSSSDEEEEKEEAVSYHSKQAKENCSTPFMARLGPAQLVPELESRSGNWKQPNDDINDIAGLPSPVNEYEDFGHVEPLAHKMKEVLELGPDPFVADRSLTRSNSCSWRLNSSSSIDEKALPSANEEESLDDVSLSFFAQDLYSGLVMEMEQKQRFRQYLEECRPSLTRPRHAEHFQCGIKGQKHTEGSEKKPVPARKKVDAGQMQLSNLNNQAPKKLGKSKSQGLSPKPHGIGYSAKQGRPKGTKSNQKGVKPADKCRSVSSGITSEKCGESGGSITVSDSFAVVKSSSDPQEDFRESMAEMIKENNIHHHGDLQRLLRCYLSLNPVEYHDIIAKVFQQVRSDLTNTSSEY